jgi:hypothetical protein
VAGRGRFLPVARCLVAILVAGFTAHNCKDPHWHLALPMPAPGAMPTHGMVRPGDGLREAPRAAEQPAHAPHHMAAAAALLPGMPAAARERGHRLLPGVR